MSDQQQPKGGDDQRTELFEIPDWLQRERQKLQKLQNRPTIPVEPARPAPQPQPQPQPPPRVESDEATSMIDMEELSRRRSEVVTTPVPSVPREVVRRPTAEKRVSAPSRPLPLLDGRRARPYLYNRLPRVSTLEVTSLRALAGLFDSGVSPGELCATIQRRLGALFKTPAQVGWGGVGMTICSGQPFRLDDGFWFWGRVPPGHHRFGVGVQQRLADHWVRGLGGTEAAVSDDFSRGLVSYVVADLTAELSKAAQWGAVCWAVNPLCRQDMELMLRAQEGPLLEMVFTVAVENVACSIRYCLPVATVRQLSQGVGELPKEQWLQRAKSAWWGGLPFRSALVLGRSTVELPTLKTMQVSDVLLVEKHGVATGLNEVEEGARLMVGKGWALTGKVENNGAGGWQFVVNAAQGTATTEEAKVEEVNGEQAEKMGFAVEATSVEVEVRLGVVEMELGDLTRLTPGQVLDCGRPMGSPVELVVNGAEVGRGELVDVDGRLGVRILALGRYSF